MRTNVDDNLKREEAHGRYNNATTVYVRHVLESLEACVGAGVDENISGGSDLDTNSASSTPTKGHHPPALTSLQQRWCAPDTAQICLIFHQTDS